MGAKVAQHYQSLAFSDVCHLALSLVKAGNKFVDEQAPWSLYKQGQQSQVNQVLYSVLEVVRLAAYLMAPIVPDLSTRVYEQLGLGGIDSGLTLSNPDFSYDRHSQWGVLQPGQPLGTPQPVFQKLELSATAPV